MTTNERIEKAKSLAAKLERFGARYWVGGSKVRVYLEYPKGYGGGAGGGKLGHLEVLADGSVRREYSAPADLAAELKAVLA